MRADEFPIDLLLLQLDDYNIFEDNRDPFSVKEGLDTPSSPEDASIRLAPKSPRSGNASPRTPSLSTSPASSTIKQKIPRHKRQSHINAEHRRRCKIQTGFEELQKLVPAIADSKSSGRESKSGMLFKTVDYCRQLRQENKELNKDIESIRKEIQTLTAEISHYQQNLPETGIAVAKPSNPDQLDQMFKDYVQSRTFQNWKFWIFGMFIRPLWETFKTAVSVSSMEEFSRSTLNWLQQHCSLIQLRPAMMNLLLQLSTKTSVMSRPECLPEEALQRTMEAAGFAESGVAQATTAAALPSATTIPTTMASAVLSSMQTTATTEVPSTSRTSSEMSLDLPLDIDMAYLQIRKPSNPQNVAKPVS